jgi:hypothetical protein
MALRTLIPALALLAACLLSGCAGGPAAPRVLTVQTGERTLVLLQQEANGPLLSLQNESCSSRVDVYSDHKSDLGLKVLDDTDMQNLLDALAAEGFFSHATQAALPTGTEAMQVRHGERSYVWTHREGVSAEELVAFARAKSYFVVAYNTSTSFHARRVGGDALKAELEAQQRRNEEARRRAGRQGQGQ